MKNLLFSMMMAFATGPLLRAQEPAARGGDFAIRGFHLDLRVQVMTMKALKGFAQKLSKAGINTLVMEWEASYPFEKHPLIPNRYAYSRAEIDSFIKYCGKLGIDVIPLQQSFGHVEYILRHSRYKDLREDQKDYSQVCPLESEGDRALFTDLFTELAASHPSKYFHIGGDETYLLGHCPRCKAKADKEGKSKLYIDHIRMLADIVISLGKRPVLWADIALKYPEAIKLLPKETIFVDWNYGWDLSQYGKHEKQLESGDEIWGSPALRSHPDNYFLSQWEKHLNNIRTFVPACRKMGYSGMVMTSWSTSGQYSPVFESHTDIIDLHAIRHVYPLDGFDLTLAAYAQSLKDPRPLEIDGFVASYGVENFGFSVKQAADFWTALRAAPFEVQQGVVDSPKPMTLQELLAAAESAAKTLAELKPLKNQEAFEHYRLMAEIRVQYLKYQQIEAEANTQGFGKPQASKAIARLKDLMATGKRLDKRFIALHKDFLKPAALAEENTLRAEKIRLLYERLSRQD